jgi:predicted site-specific integrase-resolvase
MPSIVDDHGGGEYVGLGEAVQRFGLPYSTLRAYIASGRLKASKTPNNRIWLKVRDIEALYERVEQKTTTK